MSDFNSQRQHVGDSWNGALSRPAGLYGELQPLPLPVPALATSVLKRKLRPPQGSAD